MPLLEVKGLSVGIGVAGGTVSILDRVDLSVDRGEAVGLVGESGCGKSMTALAVMGLLPDTASVAGSVRLGGEELLGKDDEAMSRVRGRRLAMVFQEPMTALDPVRTIGEQVAEGLRWHYGLARRAARKRAEELLARVGLEPRRFPLSRYPHELSGGQRQRVVIAIALACGPEILIADEPTTALDVTTQAQILDLLAEISAEEGMGLLMISHDLGVIAEMTDRMMVMYAGQVVEEGPTVAVFADMAHPYTRALFAAMPTADMVEAGMSRPARLAAIAGEVPSAVAMRFGCPFAPRCTKVEKRCRSIEPPPVRIGPGHTARCFRPGP